MPVVRVAPAAEEDLEGIWSYVAQHDAGAADKIIREITRKFAVLRDFPHAGREQGRLLVGLRSLTVGGYIIFHQPFDGGVDIFIL